MSRYKSMLQSLMLIAKEEGRGGLYAGLGPHLLRVVPNTGTRKLILKTGTRKLILGPHVLRVVPNTGTRKQFLILSF